jgi:prevent-host-death family protein
MNDLATHTSALLKRVQRSGEGILVARRYVDVVATITPASSATYAKHVPIRILSRDTYRVMNELVETGEGVTITHRGEPVAALKPVAELDALRFAAAIAAQSQEFIASLQEADSALGAGQAIHVDEAAIEALPKSRRRALAAAAI